MGWFQSIHSLKESVRLGPLRLHLCQSGIFSADFCENDGLCVCESDFWNQKYGSWPRKNRLFAFYVLLALWAGERAGRFLRNDPGIFLCDPARGLCRNPACLCDSDVYGGDGICRFRGGYDDRTFHGHHDGSDVHGVGDHYRDNLQLRHASYADGQRDVPVPVVRICRFFFADPHRAGRLSYRQTPKDDVVFYDRLYCDRLSHFPSRFCDFVYCNDDFGDSGKSCAADEYVFCRHSDQNFDRRFCDVFKLPNAWRSIYFYLQANSDTDEAVHEWDDCIKMQEQNSLIIAYNLQFFAKEGPGGEKTEEPTVKRLSDARKKGQVAKSKEISAAASLLAFFLMLKGLLSWMGDRFLDDFNGIYNMIPDTVKLYDGHIPQLTLRDLMIKMILDMTILLLPFFIVGVVLAFLTNIIQVGMKWTNEPLKPKFDKMNPISGFQRIFSAQSLFNLGLSILKIVLISIVVYNYLMGRKESLFLLYDMPLNQSIALMWDIVIQLGIRVSVIYFIVAASDFIYQKRKFHTDMKMTKQEVKDEMKDTEGDPQVKSRQRQKMREVSMRRMMQDLPRADVVITNPTHYAVAILYDADQYAAPVVLAKGADFIAQKIKDVAKENHIEIVENKPLARMLYANVEIGEQIPPELYKAVAEVLAFVYQLKGKVS